MEELEKFYILSGLKMNKHAKTQIVWIGSKKYIIISQLNHLFITLPNPQPVIMKELNSIFRFLWNSDVDKV